MTKFSIELSYGIMEALHQIISKAVVETKPDNDDDRLVIATLHGLQLRLYNRLGKAQDKYKMMLEPTEAIALRILWCDYLTDSKPTNPFSIWLSITCNEVSQQYS